MKPDSSSSLPAASRSKCLSATAVLGGIASILWAILAEPSPPALAHGAKAEPAPDPSPRQRHELRRSVAGSVVEVPASRVAEPCQEEESEWRDAFATATAIPDPALREETLARLCFQRAEIDPRGALQLAIQHGLEEAAGCVIGNLGQQWAAADLPAARDWTLGLPPGEIREDLIGRIGYVWSLSDPAAAADFVAVEATPGTGQVEAAISILHQWNLRDPGAARAWVECFPSGSALERAEAEVADLQAPAR